MEKKELRLLIAIFLVTLTIRLIFAFLIPNLTYDSYFHLRQVENVLHNGIPAYNDPYSYGGTGTRFLPLFYYFHALFAIFLPLEILAKIIPNLLLASLTIITYLISTKITENKTGPFISATIAGLLPILYSTNSFTIETLALPLIFLTIYSFLNIKNQKYIYLYIFLFLASCLTSTAAILIIVGLGIYLLLSIIEGKKLENSEKELILFSLFFFIWTQFVFFKQNFIDHGLNFIWQNIPSALMQSYFPAFSLGQTILLLSIIPLLAGIYTVYISLFQLKNSRSFLLISFVISTSILAWFNLIQFNLALSFIGIILAILFSTFYEEIINYLRKTKLSHFENIFTITLIILLLLTMLYPATIQALQQETPPDEAIYAFKSMTENTLVDAIIISQLKEGSLISFYGQRKNFMDDHFLSTKDAETRLKDLKTIYTTTFQTEALKLFDKYNIQYLIITKDAKQFYNYTKPPYINPDCFYLIYKYHQNDIYKIKCTLKNRSI